MASSAAPASAVIPNVSPAPPRFEYELPRLIRTSSGNIIRPVRSPGTFVERHFDVSRLDCIEDCLWLAGRVGNIRPFHRQLLLGRRILVTEQADLHLLWKNNVVFVKPLPAWIFDKQFFDDNVAKSASTLAAVNGFLSTFAFLVAYEQDLAIARDLHLVPAELTWKSWTELVDDVLGPLVSGIQPCSPRYQYGELRLTRINWLYRLLPRFNLRHLFRGYHHDPQTYQSFLRRNFAWLVAAFAYVTIVLTAMQVGLGTNQLRENSSFNAASYGFTIFAIIAPLVAILFVAVVSLILVVYNVQATLTHLRKSEAVARKVSQSITIPAKV